MTPRRARLAIHLAAVLFDLTEVFGKLIQSDAAVITLGRAAFAVLALALFTRASRRPMVRGMTGRRLVVLAVRDCYWRYTWITFFVPVKVGGIASHMAHTLDHNNALLAVSFRFYATEVVNVAKEAGQRGINIIAISDSALSLLAHWVQILFAIPEHDYTFSRSLAAPMCSGQALVVTSAARQSC